MKKLIIIGCGGFGREIIQYINDINNIKYEYKILGFIDDDIKKIGTKVNGIKVLGDTNLLSKLKDVYIFCAIAKPSIKEIISQKIKKYNLKTINIIHPTAYLGAYITLGENILISPMCVLTTNINIGNYVHINPQCGIGHDTTIQDFSTLYWNVNTGGFVNIAKSSELGSKTFIKQGINIGEKVISGAGAVIVKNISPKMTVKGVPAV